MELIIVGEVALAFCFILIIGTPIFLIILFKKNNVKSLNEPLFKAQDYSDEERIRVQHKSEAVAKRCALMGQLAAVFLYQCVLSTIVFLISAMVTDMSGRFATGLPLFPRVYMIIAFVCLALYGISLLWSAIAEKRLEVLCIYLGNELAGAREVTEMAQRANLRMGLGKVMSTPMVGTISSFGIGIGPTLAKLANAYLWENAEKEIGKKPFIILSITLILIQLILGIGLYMFWWN